MDHTIRTDHVAIYIRWSTEDQGEGTTLAVQSEACRHYVVSQGWEVREDLIFIDDGHSGGTLNRPALTRLRQAAGAGQVDCVVVFKLDRLSRSVIDTVTLVLQEWDERTHLKSAREPVDTTTAMGKQFFYMLVSYAEWERNVIRERMFSGKLRRAREGRSPGAPAPFGYRKGNRAGTLVVHEEEAAVVRLLFSLAEQGLPIRQVALHLNAQGIPAPRGGRWAVSTVSKILRNPAYAGRLVWGRQRVNPRHAKAPGEPRTRPATPHVDVAATSIPALVASEQFQRVQALLSGHRRLAPAAAGSAHLLTGLARCGGCGRPLQHNRAGAWAYYRCSGRTEGCTAAAIPAGPLEAAVAGLLQQRYLVRVRDEAERAAAGVQAENCARRTIARRAATAALSRLKLQVRRVDRDYRTGRLTAEERRQLLSQIAAEEQALEAAGRAQDREAAPIPTGDPWADLAPAQQKAVLGQFLAAVTARVSESELSVEVEWWDTP